MPDVVHTLDRHRLLAPIATVYLFNQVERDRWVAQQAKLVRAGSRVLDCGAGGAPYRSLFGHCDYKTHDFAKLDEGLLRERRYAELDYVSDITTIPVAEHSFDVILCTEVLEHVPDPVAVLHEFARILRGGGVLLLSAPLRSGRHQIPYHFYGGFTPEWYQRYLPASGFDIEQIEANGGFFRHYGEESMRLVKMSLPVLSGANRPIHWLILPLTLLAAVWFALLTPPLCWALERLALSPRSAWFTVGFHVKGRRRFDADASSTEKDTDRPWGEAKLRISPPGTST